MSRLRLLKVIVQPVFVVDDGEHLTEQTAEPVVVPSGGWDDFAAGFGARVEELIDQFEAGH